jgi:hypothetical protein
VTEDRRRGSCFLRFRAEDGAHGGDEPIPAILSFAEAFAAGGGQFVILGATVVVGSAPTCFEKSLADEAEQGGIEGALFDEEGPVGNLFNAEKDAVAMEGAERDGFEDEEIEGAGEKVGLV